MRTPALLLLPFVLAFVACAQDTPRSEVLDPVPFVPTPEDVVDQMLKMANVTKSDYVIDLGCGDGRIVIAAAKKYGARGLGVDLNPQRITEAKANAEQAGVANLVEFKEGDLFKLDLSKASVVTMYLLTSVNLQIRDKLLTELKPGTRLVSHAFNMGEWQPERTAEVAYKKVYFWTIPATKPTFTDTPAPRR